MLRALHIKNVVLIEHLTLEFHGGLSTLTGETGAGKSILLDSLGLALGARAESSLIRRGCDQASVTAEFDVEPEHPVCVLLQEQGMAFDRNALILRRVLGVDGRTRAFINDESVSVGFLRSVGGCLVDIHGQFETYGLLNPVTHRTVLDQYAGNYPLLSDVSKAFREWKSVDDDLAQLREEAARALENEAYLRDCVAELEALDPQEGEEAGLVEKKKAIHHLDALRECYDFIQEVLGGEQGADILMGQAGRLLQKNADKIGDGVSDVVSALDRASDGLQEACRLVDGLARRLDMDGMDIESIEDRLYALRGLARKHHCSVEDLAGLAISLKNKMNILDSQEEMIARLEKKSKEVKEVYKGYAINLHERRKNAAQRLDKIVNSELKPLKLDKSVFETSVELCHSENTWGVQGFDEVRFLVATNVSSGMAPVLEPLNKIASGGEMARFMLALKVVLADSTPHIGVFVFDEIDTGIGGATANAVGDRLAKLAVSHQVMVVTHSPQVAAQAHHHWMVSKSEGATQVVPLSGEARREEIARMLSGAEITLEARAAAAKLLDTG